MIRYLLAFIILCSTVSRLEASYNPFTPEVIKVTNTALANANASTAATQFNNFNTTALINSNSNVFTSVASDGVNCIAGTYLVDIVMYQTSTVQRSNVGIEVTVDGVATGIRGATGYIRSQQGHNESSSNVSDTVRLTSAGRIGFNYRREAAGGTVAVPVGESAMRITRIKD